MAIYCHNSVHWNFWEQLTADCFDLQFVDLNCFTVLLKADVNHVNYVINKVIYTKQQTIPLEIAIYGQILPRQL